MSDGLIDYREVPIPNVKPEDLRTAADALEDDAEDISQAGQDIKASWQGLEGVYESPESEMLFHAINPVATKGDDVDYAVGITVRALRVFANDAERIKAKLKGLKADAKAFVEEVEGDDDWREDEDKVDEHNTLNNDILAALHEYQEAERSCANKITAQFNGTTFVPADPGDKQMLNKGEKPYGTAEAMEDVDTPWAETQEHDGAWYEDAGSAVKDNVAGLLKDGASAIGVYGEDGFAGSPSEWGENLGDYWNDTLKGLVSLSGFDSENGWMPDSLGDWGSTFGNSWKVFVKDFVAWDEWDDRPGYALTQTVINIGGTAAGGGAFKSLSKVGRATDGDSSEGSNGDSDGSGYEQQPIHVGPSPNDLRQRLDRPQLHPSQINGISDSLDRLQSLVPNRATPVGGPGNPVDVDPGLNNGNGGQQYQHSGGNGGSGGSGFDGSGGRGDGSNGDSPDGDGGEVGDQGEPNRGQSSTPEQRDRQEPGSDRDGRDEPGNDTPNGHGSGGSGGDEGRGGSGGDEGKGGDEGRPDPGDTPEGDPEEPPEGEGEEPPEPASEGSGDPGSPGGPEESSQPDGESFPDYEGPKYSDLEVPQGLTPDQFTDLTEDLRNTVGHLDGEIVVQGSRATGLAKETSDIDIGIRIDSDRFDQFASERFGSPNPGSAKEKTMLHALETGKVQAGEAGLRTLRKRLEAKLGMEVDISVLSKGGQFDRPPFVKVDGDA